MSATFKDIGVTSEGHVGIVEIQRPPHNFFDNSLINQIADAFEAFDRDNNIRAYVLCAQGKSFCAGADFANRPQTGAAESGKHLYKEATRLFRSKKPSIGAIQGPAIGGGLGLALMPDFRVAAPEARFAANFTRLGFHPGFSLTFTLPRLIGQQKANLMFHTGRRIGGEQAVEWGLADVLAPLADVRKEAMKLAAEIAEVGAARRAVDARDDAPRLRRRRRGRDRARAHRAGLDAQDRGLQGRRQVLRREAAGQLEGPLVAALAGKAAIVTGGASGIGEACSETLAREGASVCHHRHRRRAGQGRRRAHHQGRRQGALPAITTCATRRRGRA